MDWRGYAFYYPIFAEYLPVKNLIVWDKGTGPGSFYSYTHEFILYGTKNAGLRRGGSNVWRENGFGAGAVNTDGEKIHPAQKPIAIIERCLLDATKEGDLVVDCFGGSCTTAAAAIRNGRRFICFEVKESNYQRAVRRIDQEMHQASQEPEQTILPGL